MLEEKLSGIINVKKKPLQWLLGYEQGYVHCKVVGNLSISQFLRHKFKKIIWRPISLYWHFIVFLHFKLFWSDKTENQQGSLYTENDNFKSALVLFFLIWPAFSRASSSGFVAYKTVRAHALRSVFATRELFSRNSKNQSLGLIITHALDLCVSGHMVWASRSSRIHHRNALIKKAWKMPYKD